MNHRAHQSPRPAPVCPSAGRPGHPDFSVELGELAGSFAGRSVRLGEVLAALRGRGYHLLLVLIALPFVSPLPLPGFSIPFGIVVALIGLRLAVNRRPWLPGWLLQKKLPPQFLARLLHGTRRVVAGMEFFLRPRLRFFNDGFVFQRLAGLLIAVSGLYLTLPFPLPFSNSLPAWTVLLLAAGSLGRDGLFFLLGCVAFAISTAFFALVALGGAEAWGWLHQLRPAG